MSAIHVEIDNSQEYRAKLEELHGKNNVWDTKQLQRDFNVIGFMSPWVGVTRKCDGQKGTLEFTHSPRFYFSFSPA